ncbi:MAG: AsmA family protein, partial [Nitrospinaceae bacterium]
MTEAEENPETHSDSPPPPGKSRKPKAKKSVAALLFKCVLALFLLLVLVLAAAGIVLQYYFPSETITPIVERQLSRVLNMPVTIGRIDFSLMRGARVQRIRLGKDFLSVREVVLDYDMTQLLQGNLIINRIVVDAPQLKAVSQNGVWNFQPILDQAGKTKSAPPKTEKPPGLPPLPVGIDLKHLSVKGVRLDLDMDGRIKAAVSGVNLEARGKVQPGFIDLQVRLLMVPDREDRSAHNLAFSSREGNNIIDVKTRTSTDLTVSTNDLNRILLAGTFSLENNAFRTGKQSLPVPDLSGELTLEGFLKEEALNLPTLLLKIADKGRVEISAEAKRFLTNPEFQLHLKEAFFDVKELAAMAAGFLPPIKARGEITVSGFQVAGRLPGFKPERIEVLGGKVSLKNLSARHPPLAAEITGLRGTVTVKKVDLQNMVPKLIDADVDIVIAAAQINELHLKNISQQFSVSAHGLGLSQGRVRFNVSLADIEYHHPELGTFKTSLKTNGTVEGSFPDGNISSAKISYAVGKLFEGNVSAQVEDFGKKSFRAAQDLRINLKEAISFFPPKLLEKLQGIQLDGAVTVHAGLDGRLDKNFRPASVRLKTEADVSGLNLQFQSPKLELNNFSAGISFPAEFDSDRGVIVPELNIHSRFDSAKALDNWEAGPTESKTRLAMENFYNFDLPGIIPVTHQTTFKMERLLSTAPELSVTGLAVDAGLKGDWHPGDFQNVSLEAKVSVQSAKGLKKFQAEKIGTTVTVDIPNLSLESIGATLKTTVESSTFQQDDMEVKMGPVT